MTFKALLAAKTGEAISTRVVEMNEQDLMPGDVTIAVDYSTVNYKDAMAITGRVDVIRQFPLIPGIDLAGTVVASSYPGIAVGDRVVANSWGLKPDPSRRICAEGAGERRVAGQDPGALFDEGRHGDRHGGLHGDAVRAGARMALTPRVSTSSSPAPMAAAPSRIALSIGYRVVASTGRLEEQLRSLGAAEIIDRRTLSEPGAPIASERWAGAVDSVGSHTLANVLAQTQYRGVVTACGLAQGLDLPGSVLPFILRNVTLAGIDSVNAPQEARIEAWSRLARDLDLQTRPHDAGGWARRGARCRGPDVRRQSPGPHRRRRQRVAPLRPFHATIPNQT